MLKNTIIQEDINQILDADIEWGKFRGKTVLISGANGFLPAYMVETLLELNNIRPDYNIKVIALVRNLEKAKKRFFSHLGNAALSFLVQDVVSEIKSSGTIDFIIHAASQASPKYYGVDPVGTLKANTLGTASLLELAVSEQVESFLYFSSSEVYGTLEEKDIPTPEDRYGYLDPTHLRSCYAESKRMGENMCISWLNQYGVPAKIVRPFHTYGPGMALDDGRVYADFVADVLSQRDIVMKSDGTAKRAFCYLADAISGFFTVLLHGKNGEAYNIGNPDCEYSILELAKIIVGLFPAKNLKVIELPEQNGHAYLKSSVNRNLPDIAKARALRWNPATSIETGFKRTINSYL